jgi:hypothetical protein
MKEIARLFIIDIPQQERMDSLYLEGNKLSFRSKNSGDIVLSTYNSYYCEAVYALDEANTIKFVDSLDATLENVGEIVSELFTSPAGLDKLKRHCDNNGIAYTYEFIVD